MLSGLRKLFGAARGEAVDAGSAEQWREEGNACLDKGDLEGAERSFRKAIEVQPGDHGLLLNLAFVLNEQGRHADALTAATQARTLGRDDADLWFVSATALQALHRGDDALAALHQAIDRQPDLEPARLALVRLLAQAGRSEEARHRALEGLELRPNSPDLLQALGHLASQAGRHANAATHYAKAAASAPGVAQLHEDHARALSSDGRLDEAIEALQRALSIEPARASVLVRLASLLSHRGRHHEAVDLWRRAVQADPSDASHHDGLSRALLSAGEPGVAVQASLAAVTLAPKVAAFLSNLGMAQHDAGQVEAALDSYRKALEIDPTQSITWANIGVCEYEQGRTSEAIRSFKEGLARGGPSLHLQTQMLHVMSFDEGTSATEYLREAIRYGELVDQAVASQGAPEVPLAPRHVAGTQPLRVGLVSGDLRNHPVGYFLEDLLPHLRNEGIELMAYSTDAREDALTERIRPHFSAWRSLAGIEDKPAVDLIRRDGLHLAIDLSGHTAANRLPLFGHRLAPVQAAWLGYFASTGVKQIDWELADAASVPPDNEGQFVERLWRLPVIRYCFSPPKEAADIDVASSPATARGHVTFGSYQNLAKVNGSTLDLWAAVLQAVPRSRFRFQSKRLALPAEAARIQAAFESRGIGMDRLQLCGPSPRAEYLRSYQEVDIVLDSFPYTGGTTTSEALWMGVPTLSLVGNTMLTRQGLAILAALGLEDWAASDRATYVDLAVAKAADIASLAALRGSLRARCQASMLFSPRRFATDLAQAWRGMSALAHDELPPSARASS